jgi:putrescine aminotransferase
MSSSQDLRDLDRHHYLHPFTSYEDFNPVGGRIFTRGDGIFIEDADGNRLLDGMSGLWCVNLGYTQPKIVAAIVEQLNTLPFYNSFFKCTNDAAAMLASELAAFFPKGFSRFFFTNSGSEANDTQLRIVHRYFDLIGKPQKKQIVSRFNGYHGSTIGAGSLSGMSDMHRQFPKLPGIHHVIQPYMFGDGADEAPETFAARAATAVADAIDRIGADNVAAFIAEPVQGAGGVIIPPPGYWTEVERICRERDVLLISDEVICGFGRTGYRFGCESFGVTPDLITFAKAVTNGFQPLGGVGLSDRIADVLVSQGGEFAHGFTYSGHPVPCAAARATLSIINAEGIVEKARQTGLLLRQRLESLCDHPIVGEVRTHGMLAAIELVADKNSRTRLAPQGRGAYTCRDFAIAGGLMVRAVGDAIITAPPLIISPAQIDLLLLRLRHALDQTAQAFAIRG